MGRLELVVHRRPGQYNQGVLRLGARAVTVALGRSGTGFDKREGDGRTPAGRFAILGVRYRPDRMMRPATRLPVRPIRPDDGWCDDAADRRYNRPVRLPLGGARAVSHERMWRQDHLYDLVLLLDHNTRPRVRGRGSAVFVHMARPGLLPTEGCVALRPAELRRLVNRLGPGASIAIRHG